MRAVNDLVISTLEGQRTISGSLTLRDNRLVFTERAIDDSLGLSDPSSLDLDVYGEGVARVVNFEDGLWLQIVDDPTDLSWPAWTDQSIALAPGSRPGIQDSRFWYQKSNGDICFQDLSDIGSETVVTSAYAAFVVTCAPVNTSTCYIHYLDGPWGAIARISETFSPVAWPGRVYGEAQTNRYFDAVSFGATDYLYFADNNDGRVMVVKVLGGVWSDAQYVVPLDVVDTDNFFRLGYANLLGYITTNILENSSFTSPPYADDDNWHAESVQSGWAYTSGGGSPAVAWSEEEGLFGGSSMKLLQGSSYLVVYPGKNGVENKLTIQPGERATAAIWVKKAAGAGSVELRISQADAGTLVSDSTTGTGEWERLVAQYTSNFGSETEFKLQVHYDNPAADVAPAYVDGAMFYIGGLEDYISEAGVDFRTVFLTGRYSRRTDHDAVALDMYTRGPDNYSFGRELFIDRKDTGGKLFLLGSTVWYIGANRVYSAPATNYMGYDGSDTKLETDSLFAFGIEQSNDGKANITASLPYALRDNSIVRKGSEGSIEVVVNGFPVQMATFNIDDLQDERSEQGNDFQLAGLSATNKRLTRWTSDQSYDYWSQARQSSEPGELDEVIRASGTWEISAGSLGLDTLNVEGVLYMVAKASRGGLMRAKFQYPTGDWHPQLGVALNYYQETRIEAGERLGIDPFDVGEDQVGHNGILAVYGDDQDDGSEGVAVYLWRDSAKTLLTSAPLTIPADTWFWLQLNFQDGLTRVLYRADADTDWTEVTRFIFDDPDFLPWKRETFGRGAVYIDNVTDNSTTPGFSSEDTLIPVESSADFPASETVIVDDEIISYDSKTSDTPLAGAWTRAEGITLFQADHSNPYFQNITLYSKPTNVTPYTQKIASVKANTVVACAFQLLHPSKVKKLRIRLKKEGSPARSAKFNLSTDNFDEDVRLRSGNCVAENFTSIPAASITGSFAWYDLDIPTAFQKWIPADNYFIVVFDDTVDNKAYSASDHYDVEVDANAPVFGKASVRAWGYVSHGNGAWATILGGTPYAVACEAIGDTRDGSGYEIYLEGAGAPADRTAYNGYAMVVTDGPGAGSVFTVTDYDYQAPDQWVYTETYEAPDKWQDHIGDLTHGSWATPDMSRVFVLEDPSSIIGEGSVLQMFPALHILERALNYTTSTSHGAGTVSLYRDLTILVDRVDFYSLEPDKSMCDMITELTVKAGATEPICEMALEDTYDFDGYLDWGAPVWLDDRINFIADFSPTNLPAGSELGVVFRADGPYTVDVLAQGYIVSLTADQKLRFYIISGYGPALLEEYPIDFVPSGLVRVSAYEDGFSVWINGRFVHTFRDGTWTDGENAGLIGFDICSVKGEWTNIDMRVDNFIFDMGSAGDQLLDGLIGSKQIYHHDNEFGVMKVFRELPDLGDVPNIIFAGGEVKTDTEFVSRLRSEGAETAEVVDFDIMRTEGNIFAVVNADEANNAAEAYSYGQRIMRELASMATQWSGEGAADPRIEPNDRITVVTPVGDITIAVNAVTFQMTQSELAAVFSMSVGGRDAADL